MKSLVLAFFLAAALLGAADVTGQWSGTMTITTPSGEQRQRPILLVLKQDGAKITGTGGPTAEERHDILEGKIDGDKLSLTVEAGDAPIKLELTLAGDELSGDASRERPDGEKQAAKVQARRDKAEK